MYGSYMRPSDYRFERQQDRYGAPLEHSRAPYWMPRWLSVAWDWIVSVQLLQD